MLPASPYSNCFFCRYILLLEPIDPAVKGRHRTWKDDILPSLSVLAVTLRRYLEHPISTLVLQKNLKVKNEIGNFRNDFWTLFYFQMRPLATIIDKMAL